METVQYLSAQDVSEMWGITKRRVQNLCVNNRIPGAFRIGNMWAIPANAVKPKDARVKEHIEEQLPLTVSIRKARRALKSLVETAICELSDLGMSDVEALHTIIVLFASKLLKLFLREDQDYIEVCTSFFRCSINSEVPTEIDQNIDRFIAQYENCLDDSLSWVYQFATKRSDLFKYKDTQFFTEKYMISTLVDSVGLDENSIVIDPACGGCNFLLYSFERIVEKSPKKSATEKVDFALNRLYGYEIDPFLAYVGSFNLKLKALAYIGSEREISLSDFKTIHPLVFYPENETVSGFLDIEWEKQFVINCDTQETLQLVDAFDGANVVVTNPPFRTIKGMPLEQKDFLQQFYPMSKCDMCNAFIERIMGVLPENGKAAMVTQNSWMYLDSFTALREKLLKEYTLNCIWELGSNAFYDLSGEKANVALLTITKKNPEENNEIELGFLRTMSIEDIETAIESKTIQLVRIKQTDVLRNTGSRFDMVSTDHLKSLQIECDQYKDYAVPMQGTSTGDAKNLIDFFWNHIGDEDWVLVSKGGGYSRFEGLNSYCVKWGKDGEYIKATKGSAIRNANYFSNTQLVFSDTGTAGLNVRVLLPGQVFVASGPGIRITKGKKLAHLAFLNSRFAAFFVRLLSPKLTIAAGYIGKIPATEKLLDSAILEMQSRKCLAAKKNRLMKRPNNFEFVYLVHTVGKSIREAAKEWFLEDISDEWKQLIAEQVIEDEIAKEMHLTAEDKKAIDGFLGSRTVISLGEEEVTSITKSDVSGLLGFDCFPRRTKANKKALGSDGLIEYVSQIKGLSCETVKSFLEERFEWFESNYVDLYMLALTLSALKYRDRTCSSMTTDALITAMNISDKQDTAFATLWIESRFNIVHSGLFEEESIYHYDLESKTMKSGKE